MMPLVMVQHLVILLAYDDGSSSVNYCCLYCWVRLCFINTILGALLVSLASSWAWLMFGMIKPVSKNCLLCACLGWGVLCCFALVLLL